MNSRVLSQVGFHGWVVLMNEEGKKNSASVAPDTTTHIGVGFIVTSCESVLVPSVMMPNKQFERLALKHLRTYHVTNEYALISKADSGWMNT